MPLHPRTCSILYSVSCLLDALDGLAARHFEQSTKFGAVLDMVTDRCTTTCLLVFLASAFPRWSIVFQGLISLDLASHYMHMYATLSMGDAGQSHKNVDESRSWLLKMYYSNNVCGFCYERGIRRTLLTSPTESTIYLLRSQRTLLHRPLPPFLLFPLPITYTFEGPWTAVNASAWDTSGTETVYAVYKSMVGGCYGDGEVSLHLDLMTISRS